MTCVQKLLCAVACCYLLAACGSDQSIYTDVEAPSATDESPENSDNSAPSDDDTNGQITADPNNPVPPADNMNGQIIGNSDNPATSADNDIPTATLQSLASNESIDNFPIEFNGTATSDSSGITAVDILVHNTATMENLQADGTMGPYTELQAMLDNPGENTTAWSLNVESLPPGTYYIAVRATDGASQVSEWKSTDFSVASSNDKVAPAVTLRSLTPDQVQADFPFEFFGEATDDLSGIAAVDIAVHNRATQTTLQADGTMGAFVRLRAELDNPGENTTTWSFSVTSLPPGPYYVAVRAIDGESQISEQTLINFSVPSSIDNVVPSATLQSVTPDQVITDFPFIFAGEATDDLSGIAAVDIALRNKATATHLQADGTMGAFVRLRAELDNPGENTTNWSFSVASLPPGPYFILVRAIDGESQISEQELTDFSVPSFIDNVVPTVTLQSVTPDQEITDFPFIFAGVATDDLSGIAAVDIAVHNKATEKTLQADGTMGAFVRLRAELDNPGENTTAWSYSVTSLPPGPYYVVVRAIDGESQISEQTLIDFSVPSSIDIVAPSVTVQTPSPDK